MSDRDMTRLDLGELAGIVAGQPYPLAFATVDWLAMSAS